ncbi:hypothetical protein GCM10009037_09420 [Halarchaeum grantii]|uniref:Uncharacterized protein n=1 Tax=Halarchaeum grantii TaxID=1193105 RepID=A0A830F7T9_9EURY|nr:hypothetical protein GCM10009037_09420 [Halarchaeum grantii]
MLWVGFADPGKSSTKSPRHSFQSFLGLALRASEPATYRVLTDHSVAGRYYAVCSAVLLANVHVRSRGHPVP